MSETQRSSPLGASSSLAFSRGPEYVPSLYQARSGPGRKRVHFASKDKWHKTRIGTVVGAYHLDCLSGQRDIGGSVVTRSGRIVLSVGASDLWLETCFKIAVSDDGGKSFTVKFERPAIEDVTYHTTGMLYDEKNDVLMAIFGETKGFQLFNERNQYDSGVREFSMDDLGHGKLMMARSTDSGDTWKLFTLRDYREIGKPWTVSGGLCGCGVQEGDDIFVPLYAVTANEEKTARRCENPLMRIRTLTRGSTSESFEFEHDFRMLTTNSDFDIRYASETVYLRKLDRSGFLSFHRTGDGMPYRREYDNEHRPTADFRRVQSRGFDRRDYDPGKQGPVVVAFNVIRMLDGNLMLASRFYGTEHHAPGMIFLTSRDEGLAWDYEDDQIPCFLDPFELYPAGGGGNPSMSYLPDASLVHTTSAGTREPRLADGGTLICRFLGFDIGVNRQSSAEGTVSLDVSGVVGLEPVYIGNCSLAEKKDIEFPNCNGDIFALSHYTSDRRKITIPYRIKGENPRLGLRVTLANRSNSYRPSFEPGIALSSEE